MHILPKQTNTIVECRGDKLGVTLWQGKQWSVTTDGIELRDGTYFIAKNRIYEEKGTWGWRKHMAEKSWVDLDDFNDAIDSAEVLFDKNGKRSNVNAPVILGLGEAEDIAATEANKIYELTRKRLLEGRI